MGSALDVAGVEVGKKLVWQSLAERGLARLLDGQRKGRPAELRREAEQWRRRAGSNRVDHRDRASLLK